MPAEITARSKVDISRVTRLFDTARPCRGGSICLLSGQRRVSPDSAESGGLLRHNIRLTRDCNWNCGGPGKIGKRLPEGTHKRRGGAAARCRRHRSSGDARRRHRRSPRTRTPPNDLTKKCSSEHRPRPGFRTAKSERPLRAQGFGDMPRIKSPHQRTGAVAGLCPGKVGKRLERRRGSRTRPVSIVTGVEMARLRSKRRGSGICPAQGHRRMT